MENKSERLDALSQLLDIISIEESAKRKENKYKIMAMRAKKRYRRIKILYTSGITVAACFAGLLILSLSGTKEMTGMQLYNKFYEPHHFQIEYRADSVSKPLFITAINYYLLGDNDSSLAIIETLEAENQGNPEFLLLQNLVNIELNNYFEARSGFSKIIKYGGSYKITGLWYLGLCDLALGDLISAEKSFIKLSNTENSEISRNSRKILKKLIH